MNLRDKNNRAQLEYTLEAQTNDELDLKLLKAYLEATEKYGNTKILKYQALKLKYEALTAAPSTIEKTMTPAQLFAVDSPLWALDHNPDKIKQMINHLRNYPKNEKIFNIVLEEVSNGIALFNKFGLAK